MSRIEFPMVNDFKVNEMLTSNIQINNNSFVNQSGDVINIQTGITGGTSSFILTTDSIGPTGATGAQGVQGVTGATGLTAVNRVSSVTNAKAIIAYNNNRGDNLSKWNSNNKRNISYRRRINIEYSKWIFYNNKFRKIQC